MGVYKYSLESMKELFREKGYELLEESYINTSTKMRYLCGIHKDNGVQYITFGHLQRGQGCKFCSIQNGNYREKLDYEYVKTNFEKVGYLLLSTSYTKSSSKLKYICPIHPDTSQEITWNNFQRGRRCKFCSSENKAKKMRLSIEDIKEKFEEVGYTLISNKYFKNTNTLEYICNNHHEKGIQKISYVSFQQGTRCRYCHLDKIRHSLDFIKEQFSNRGYTLLENNYVNTETKMRYICKNHPTKIQKIRYGDLSQGYGCRFCAIDKNSGENSNLWKGGLTPLSNHLRRKIVEWKKDSLKENGYICVISGAKNIQIHHLFPFSKIIEDTINELNLPILKKISEYSNIELLAIEEKCLEIHYRYPLGVPISIQLHQEFHKLYGKENNTPEQFEEFKQRKLIEYEENKKLGDVS
jgi:hypothetical protein